MPRVLCTHGNTNAVSMYFNTDLRLPDPEGGADIVVRRGTLFGQLTLAGHGMSYSSVEIPSFEREIEVEIEDGQSTMPLNPSPFPSVFIEDFAPDYNVMPPVGFACAAVTNGMFVFTVTNVTPRRTNYVQVNTDLRSSNWLTVATNVPTTNRFSFTNAAIGADRQRFFRVRQQP